MEEDGWTGGEEGDEGGRGLTKGRCQKKLVERRKKKGRREKMLIKLKE